MCGIKDGTYGALALTADLLEMTDLGEGAAPCPAVDSQGTLPGLNGEFQLHDT